MQEFIKLLDLAIDLANDLGRQLNAIGDHLRDPRR